MDDVDSVLEKARGLFSEDPLTELDEDSFEDRFSTWYDLSNREDFADFFSVITKLAVEAEQRLVELARQRGHAAESHLIRAPTAEGILAEAERIGAARIVAKRRDRGLAAATLLGSTTRTLLRQATCPVLVLPP